MIWGGGSDVTLDGQSDATTLFEGIQKAMEYASLGQHCPTEFKLFPEKNPKTYETTST